MREGVEAGPLRFVASARRGGRGAEFVFLCVPTPQGDDGSADLSFVEAVAEEIAPELEPGAIVVNKSTVPVGSATRGRAGHRPGTTSRWSPTPSSCARAPRCRDSLHPDRIVVGADDQRAAARVGELFAATGAPLIVTDAATAETIKYASNAFLATKLSFVNAVAGLCEAVGADVRDVILGLGYDKRIGFEFLRPGPGLGRVAACPRTRGPCCTSPRQAGYDFSLLRGAIATNDEQLARVVDKVGRRPWRDARRRARSPSGASPSRRAPTTGATRRRSRWPGGWSTAGAAVRAFDPTVGPRRPPGRPRTSTGIWSSCRRPLRGGCAGAAVRGGADRVGRVPLARLRQGARRSWPRPSVVDARNLLDPAALRRLGFAYTGIGRP